MATLREKQEIARRLSQRRVDESEMPARPVQAPSQPFMAQRNTEYMRPRRVSRMPKQQKRQMKKGFDPFEDFPF